jgi:alpha-N-arabinofuranosidase
MKRHPVLASLLAFAALAVSSPASAETAPVAVRIDASERAAPVSPFLYGMFIEPIGNLVARSLWAEMLDDRKFYADVRPASEDPTRRPVKAGRRASAIASGVRSAATAQWRWTGPTRSSAAEPEHRRRGPAQGPGTGRHRHRRGAPLRGSVWLSGDPTARVEVALVWGDAPPSARAIVLPAPAAGWRKAEFAFTGRTDSPAVRFEITGTGTGRFRVAAPSLMPADNIDGWRADTTALARSLHSGMWRLPGGNFLSNWDWHEALGERDRRNPMFDHAWSAIQSNDIGMDEWLALTRILEVEPYVTVNAGLGDANSAAELVEYLNGSAETYWAGSAPRTAIRRRMACATGTSATSPTATGRSARPAANTSCSSIASSPTACCAAIRRSC